MDKIICTAIVLSYQPDCAPSHMVGNTLLIFSIPSTCPAPVDTPSPAVISVTVGPSGPAPWAVCTPEYIAQQMITGLYSSSAQVTNVSLPVTR